MGMTRNVIKIKGVADKIQNINVGSKELLNSAA
jgi:hypothetical protein